MLLPSIVGPLVVKTTKDIPRLTVLKVFLESAPSMVAFAGIETRSKKQALPDPARVFPALREEFPVPVFRELAPYLLIYMRKSRAWTRFLGQTWQISLYFPDEQGMDVQKQVRR